MQTRIRFFQVLRSFMLLYGWDLVTKSGLMYLYINGSISSLMDLNIDRDQ